MSGDSAANRNRRPPGPEVWARPRSKTVIKSSRSALSDPLESFGLVSKGQDNRLLDYKVQESYYDTIVERYMHFCAAAGRGDALDKAFASLSLDTETQQGASTKVIGVKRFSTDHARDTSKELSVLMMAIRKLREAIVASSRTDIFAQRVYMFVVRAAILTRHMESYHPAVLHLLRNIHVETPLGASHHHEFVGYYILDLACRQGDLAAAHAVRVEYKFRDARIEGVINALAHGNWFQFWRISALVDGYQRRLLEWADEGMRTHALKSLGRGYLSVDKRYVEMVANRSWEALQEKDRVGWELSGDKVIIRRVKGKA